MGRMAGHRARLWLVGVAAAAFVHSVRAELPDLPVDEKQEEQFRRAAGREFEVQRTPHYLIAYNTDEQLVRDLISRVEYTYSAVYAFCEAMAIPAEHPDRRLEIIFFNQRPAYDRYAHRQGFHSGGTYGVYFESANRSAFYNMHNDPDMIQLQADIAEAHANLDRLERSLADIPGDGTEVAVQLGDGRRLQGTKSQLQPVVAREVESTRRELDVLDARRQHYSDRINLTVIQHEVAHQVLFNAGVHVRGGVQPRWLTEGMACLFETPPNERGSGIGRINQERLKDFRTAVAGEKPQGRLTAIDFIDAVHDGRFVSLDRLVSDPNVFTARGDTGAVSYGLAWALAYYLQRTHRDEFAAYLRDLRDRPAGSKVSPTQELDLFETHFGQLDLAFAKRFGGYVLRLAFRPPES